MERRWRSSLARIGALSSLLMLAAAPAEGADRQARVRFVQALPGVAIATLDLGRHKVGTAAFGAGTGLAAVEPGRTTVRMTSPGGLVLRGRVSLDAAVGYTAISLDLRQGPHLRFYPNGRRRPGVARLRVVQAAPELGRPDLQIGGRIVSRTARFGSATPYSALKPGAVTVRVEDPAIGEPMLPPRRLSLRGGSVSTLVVIGSRGKRLRTILLDDLRARPSLELPVLW